MAEWFTAGYFTMSLQVRRGPEGRFTLLGQYVVDSHTANVDDSNGLIYTAGSSKNMLN